MGLSLENARKKVENCLEFIYSTNCDKYSLLYWVCMCLEYIAILRQLSDEYTNKDVRTSMYFGNQLYAFRNAYAHSSNKQEIIKLAWDLITILPYQFYADTPLSPALESIWERFNTERD